MFTTTQTLPTPSHTPQQLLELVNSPEPICDDWLLEAANGFRLDSDPAWLLPWALGLWRVQRFEEVLAVTALFEGPGNDEVDLFLLRASSARRCNGFESVAHEAFRRCLQLAPHRADVHYNYANYLAEEQPSSAAHHYLISLRIDPTNAAAWHNLGLAYSSMESHLYAISAFQLGLTINPHNADAWCNLGLSYQAIDRIETAKRSYSIGIAEDQAHAPSHINMGNALVSLLMPEQALAFLERGCSLDPGSTKSLFNLSLAHLVLGNFPQGWRYYESRFSTDAFATVRPPTAGPKPASLSDCPRYGQPPLVVWTEQGMGDAIQFGRYLNLLEAAGIPYEFHSRKLLLTLFRDWFQCGDRVVLRQSATDLADHRPQIALMSLPSLFNTSLSTVPCVTPYLFPPSPAPKSLHLNSPPGGIGVGIAWATNPDNAAMYRHKSIPLQCLLPPLLRLVDLDLAELHCLQVGSDVHQLDPWRDRPGLHDWSPLLHDFSDTAHVISQLDLVISVDTAVAHLSGALGKPTWLLLPYNADYRWLKERSDSVWYPTVRLLRQQKPGDWDSVLDQLRSLIDELYLLDINALSATQL